MHDEPGESWLSIANRDYNLCPFSPNGDESHKLDPNYAQPVPELTDDGIFVLDVLCRECGMTTSVRIDPSDLEWN